MTLEFLTGGNAPVKVSFPCLACLTVVENGPTQMTFSKMTESRHVLFVCPNCGWTNKLNAHRDAYGRPLVQGET